MPDPRIPRFEPSESLLRGRFLISGPASARGNSLGQAYLGSFSADMPNFWVTASRQSSEEVQRLLLGQRAGLLDPGVRTLPRLTDAALLTSRHRLRPMSPVQRRRLISGLVSRGQRRRSFEPLRPLHGTSGLIDLLERRFSDLRRLGLAAGPAGDRLRQTEGVVGGALARLYEDYLAQLEADWLIDSEGMVSLAAEHVEQHPTRSGAFVIDLHEIPSPTEARLLTNLGKQAELLLIALPGRSDFLANKARIEFWQGQFDDLQHAESRGEEDTGSAHSLIRRSLFSEAAQAGAEEAVDQRVEVVAGANRTDSLRRVASRIKRLLNQGVAPEEMVIASPNLADAAPRVAEVLDECGAPYFLDCPPKLGDSSTVKALVSLLRAAESDWAFHDLLAVIGRGDLDSLAVDESQRAAAEWFLRELQAPSGRRYLLRQAESLAARAAEKETRASSLEGVSARASEFFSRLDSALQSLPNEATPIAWFDSLSGLLQQLGHNASSDPQHHNSVDSLEEAFAGIETLDQWRGNPPSTLSRAEVLELIDAWSARLTLAQPTKVDGRVRVVSAATAVGIGCSHLFVIDAGEESFSAGRTDPEGELGRKNTPDEQLLRFYELACRPTKSLTFAYPALDDKAQPRLPSPYVTELEQLFAPGVLRSDEPLLQTVTHKAPPCSSREWKMQSVSRALEGDTQELAALFRSPGGEPLQAALASIAARGSGDAFGDFEGALGGGTHALLLERFGPARLWSPTQLELYATCPFKFFSRHVLGGEPIGDLGLDVDYRRRGSLVHDALAKCCAQLAESLAPGEAPGSLPEEEIVGRLIEALQEMSRSDRLPRHEAALAAIEAQQATEWAGEYPRQQREYDKAWSIDQPLTPNHFEARFGPARSDEEDEDPLSSDEPLEIDLPNGERLRVTGRIDRIDRGRAGDQEVFSVIDYKTAKRVQASSHGLATGQQLQLALYTLAAQRVLLAETGALPVAAGYWAVQEKGFVQDKKLPLAEQAEGTVKPTQAWLEAVDSLAATLQRIVQGVRSGSFPMVNEDEKCGSRCEFRTTCRVAQARSLGKSVEGSSERGPGQ